MTYETVGKISSLRWDNGNTTIRISSIDRFSIRQLGSKEILNIFVKSVHDDQKGNDVATQLKGLEAEAIPAGMCYYVTTPSNGKDAKKILDNGPKLIEWLNKAYEESRTLVIIVDENKQNVVGLEFPSAEDLK